MSPCGVWQSSQRLIAVIVNDAGEPCAPITTRRIPEHCATLLHYLVTVSIDALVVTERSYQLIAQAHAAKLCVYTVPHDLLEAIRHATGLNQRPLRYTAALLARWPLNPTLRIYLREPRPQPTHDKQLALF
jgi:hypothetical protein